MLEDDLFVCLNGPNEIILNKNLLEASAPITWITYLSDLFVKNAIPAHLEDHIWPTTDTIMCFSHVQSVSVSNK